jgi:CDP-4-dehydro-6-deoxyglucose reductase
MHALEQGPGVHSYRAVAVTRAGARVAVLHLEPACKTALRYRAGQYVTVELTDGTLRAYSPATGMQADGRLELHVQLHTGGLFSQRVKQGARR